jgi:hypothetical protein
MDFIFDIDGTISNNGKNVDPKTEKAILNILENNANNVIFASARPIRDMLPLLNKEFHNCQFIGCNGGIHYKSGNFGKTHHFNKSEISKIVEFLDEHNIPYVLDSDWHYYFSKTKHEFQDYIESLSNYKLEKDDIIDKGITKLLILDQNIKNTFINFLKMTNLAYNLNNHTKDNFFDITPNKNNKYIALLECGINVSKSYCFGNDENDFKMLENAKVSIFVSGENTFDKATINTTFANVHNIIEQLISPEYNIKKMI